MNHRKQVRVGGCPQVVKEKPMRLSGALKDFEKGVLCFVVARRYGGKGPVKLILHVAVAEGLNSYGYGAFGHYVVAPGTLMGMSTSREKREAAAFNGRKGGRPAAQGH
jgi:hypothetical protein